MTGPLVAYHRGIVRELIQLAPVHFDELTLPDLVAWPVYYCEFEGKIRVWPKPMESVVICRLEAVDLKNG